MDFQPLSMLIETEVHSTNSEPSQINSNQGVIFMIISNHAGYEAGVVYNTLLHVLSELRLQSLLNFGWNLTTCPNHTSWHDPPTMQDSYQFLQYCIFITTILSDTVHQIFLIARISWDGDDEGPIPSPGYIHIIYNKPMTWQHHPKATSPSLNPNKVFPWPTKIIGSEILPNN